MADNATDPSQEQAEPATVPVRMRIPKELWDRFKALYPDMHSTHFIISGLLRQHVTRAEARLATDGALPIDPFIDGD